jgi:hypothetical protein
MLFWHSDRNKTALETSTFSSSSIVKAMTKEYLDFIYINKNIMQNKFWNGGNVLKWVYFGVEGRSLLRWPLGAAFGSKFVNFPIIQNGLSFFTRPGPPRGGGWGGD